MHWILFAAALSCTVCDVVAQEKPFEMRPAEVTAYLARLREEKPAFGDRVAAIAAGCLGTPYVGDPLGEGPDGKYDKDPLMDLAHVDCVTFVEQAIALAASRSYDEAQARLQEIRYKEGQIAYECRNHFMVADWVANNAFCRNVTGELKTPPQTVTRIISKKTFFENKQWPGLATDAPDRSIELAYVAAGDAARAEQNLPSPSLILFIGKLDWLFSIHCGLYVRDTSGDGRLYHASSKAEKVVAAPLPSMFENTTRYLGFTAYAIEEPGE